MAREAADDGEPVAEVLAAAAAAPLVSSSASRSRVMAVRVRFALVIRLRCIGWCACIGSGVSIMLAVRLTGVVALGRASPLEWRTKFASALNDTR
jgi:hypothetical protein